MSSNAAATFMPSWFGTAPVAGRPVPGSLPSRQYGPAWVADHTTGTTHDARLAVLVDIGWPISEVDSPENRDAIARAYARAGEHFADQRIEVVR